MSHGLTALVIGGVDHGESNRVVHLMTAHGRIAAFAPAAKLSRRRFLGALEPFTTITVTFAARRRGDLETMESAQVERARLGIRSDLARIALASYGAELVGRIAPEGDGSLGLYGALTELLDHLEGAAASRPLRAAFELRLLSLLGYEQLLSACVICGEAEGERFLDLRRGGVLCGRHREGARTFGPKTAAWAEAVLAAESLDPEVGLAPDWAVGAAEKLRLPLAGFYQGLLDRPLKSEGLLLDLGL